MSKTKITINQNPNIIENVDKSIIGKLSNLIDTIPTQNGLSSDSDFVGHIKVPVAKPTLITKITNQFNDLIIDVDDIYIEAADSYINQVLVNTYSSDPDGLHKSVADAITQLNSDIFRNNSNIEDFRDLSTIFPLCTTIKSNCFRNSSIKKLDLSNINNIEEDGLREIDVNEINTFSNITTLGNRAFYKFYYNNGDQVMDFLGLINASNYRYQNVFCRMQVKQAYFPNLQYIAEVCQFIDDTSMFNTAMAQFLYFRDINAFYPGNFSLYPSKSDTSTKKGHIVINATTPPELRNYNNKTDTEIQNESTANQNKWAWWKVIGNRTDNFYIYVPDSAISTYENDPKWGQLGTMNNVVGPTFKGMSELSRYATKELWIAAGGPIALIEEFM